MVRLHTTGCGICSAQFVADSSCAAGTSIVHSNAEAEVQAVLPLCTYLTRTDGKVRQLHAGTLACQGVAVNVLLFV